MADLKVKCYGNTANDGNIQCPDRFLGFVTISSVSSTSQSASLKPGTRIVELETDATVEVFFRFGVDSATAVTTDDSIRPDLDQKIRIVGINDKSNNVVAARTTN